MPKMHYCSTNFQKSPSAEDSQHPVLLIIFDFSDLKLSDVTKFGFLSWLWRNRTSKNQLWRHFNDIMSIMSSKNVTKMSQNFSILVSPPNLNIWLRQWA